MRRHVLRVAVKMDHRPQGCARRRHEPPVELVRPRSRTSPVRTAAHTGQACRNRPDRDSRTGRAQSTESQGAPHRREHSVVFSSRSLLRPQPREPRKVSRPQHGVKPEHPIGLPARQAFIRTSGQGPTPDRRPRTPEATCRDDFARGSPPPWQPSPATQSSSCCGKALGRHGGRPSIGNTRVAPGFWRVGLRPDRRFGLSATGTK